MSLVLKFFKSSFWILFIAVTFSFAAYLPGESSYPSLSWDHGVFGNPAGVSALGSNGLFVETGKENGETLFRLGGNYGNYGVGFHYLTDNEKIDETYWNFSHGFSLFENLFFIGNRLEAFRSSDFNGTEWYYSPGVIFRPFPFLSLGYTSKNLGYIGSSSLKRVQEWGATLRYQDFSASIGVKDLDEFHLLCTMNLFDFMAGVEIPISGDGPYRLSFSHPIGSSFNALVRFSNEDYLPHQFRLGYHTAKDLSASRVGIIRVPLNSEIKEISEKGIPFLFSPTVGIQTVRNHIEHILKIPGNTIVIFDFSGYAGGFSISKEIQRGIKKIQKDGKFVIAFLDDVRPSTWVASASANYILASPSSRVSFKGFSSTTLYYQELLNKVGVQVEFLRHGKYKSAVEPYTANSMSKEARENLEEIFKSRWELFKNEKQESANTLDSFALKPQITAYSAYKAGLIDTMLYIENVPEFAVQKIFGIKAPFASAATFKATDKNIFENNWGHKPRIALITIEGTITENTVAKVKDEINQLYGESYRALILRINSPGGSAKASDALYSAIQDVSKRGIPVVASIGDYGASGGFYIACAADKIVAEKFSLVGSIGIYGGKIDASALMSKLGVKSETVKTHPHADAESFTRPLEKSEKEALQTFMDDFYDRFLGVVSKATSKSKDFVDKNLGEGKVFVGESAKAFGLIHELGGLDKAIAMAKELSDVSENKGIELVSLSDEKSFEINSLDASLSQVLLEYGKLQVWVLDFNLLNLGIEK